MEVYFKETSKLLCGHTNKPGIEYPILRDRVIEYPILCEHKEERHYKFSAYARHFAIQKVNSSNTFLSSFQFDCSLDQWLEDNRRNLSSPTYLEWKIHRLCEAFGRMYEMHIEMRDY